MNNDETAPQWLVNSVENIDQIIPKIEMIKRSGQAEVTRGLEKEQKADELLSEMNYLHRVLTQNHNNEYLNDPTISGSGFDMNNQLVHVNDDFEGILNTVYGSEINDAEVHTRFLNTISSTDSSAGTAVYLGASIEERIQSISPSYTPIFSTQKPNILSSRDTILSELIELLRPFGEKYISMIEGSENSILSDDPDSSSQAAHSMRDCFEEILKELAPSKVVRSQPWFEPTPGAPSNVSRRSRLRYMLYGSGENIDESDIKRYDDIAAAAKNSLDSCIKLAHDHDLSLTREETCLAIDQSRRSLLIILKLFNEFWNK